MTNAERAAEAVNFAYVSRILSLYPIRLEDHRSAGGRAIDVANVLNGSAPQPESDRITPLFNWLIAVAWSVYDLAATHREALKTAAIITARTTRRAKSAEASWERIAAEVQDSENECKKRFHIGLAVLALAFEERKIRPEIGGEIADPPADRCAARELSAACVIEIPRGEEAAA